MSTRRKQRIASAIAAGLLGLLFLTGCGGANNADLKGVRNSNFEKVQAFVNIDGHPNIVRFCIDGLAFYTVSHDQMAPYQQERLTRAPYFDGWCAK